MELYLLFLSVMSYNWGLFDKPNKAEYEEAGDDGEAEWRTLLSAIKWRDK